MKCEVFGCQNNIYRRLTIGPGTSTALCETHFVEFKKELMPEAPNQGGGDAMPQDIRTKGVLEIRLEGVDIPKAGVLADLLQEWVTWVKVYDALLEDVGGLNDLRQRTTEAVQKWGRDG